MLTFIFRHPLVMTIGVALVVISVVVMWRKHRQVLTGQLGEGKVVALIPHTGTKGGVSYTLRIAYTRQDGTGSEFETTMATSPPTHQTGESVHVVYYADATPSVLAFADLYLVPWICFSAGVAVLLVCAGLALGPGLVDSLYLSQLGRADPLKIISR